MNIIKRWLLTRLDFKYGKTDSSKSEFETTDLSSRQYEFDKTYGVMKDRNDLMKSLLTDTFGNHMWVKKVYQSCFLLSDTISQENIC
jgi:hypothetical protein